MAPSTRLTNRSTPLPDRYIVYEADTVKKTRFFDAFDARFKDGATPLRSICNDLQGITPTAQRWLRQRNLIGQNAYRRTRKISLRLGRPFSVSQNQLEMLISPSQTLSEIRPMKLSSTTTTSHLASAVCREILLGELMEVGATSRPILVSLLVKQIAKNEWNTAKSFNLFRLIISGNMSSLLTKRISALCLQSRAITSGPQGLGMSLKIFNSETRRTVSSYISPHGSIGAEKESYNSTTTKKSYCEAEMSNEA
ncbi:hypothetical protein N7G274_002548 [Stereocaulon virgatum]|uniref:Uncharacterized protein n=1 Tax=Stereocaulon virgatum TaxID=373712 RepID=A0ABR4AG47_9LECA